MVRTRQSIVQQALSDQDLIMATEPAEMRQRSATASTRSHQASYDIEGPSPEYALNDHKSSATSTYGDTDIPDVDCASDIPALNGMLASCARSCILGAKLTLTGNHYANSSTEGHFDADSDAMQSLGQRSRKLIRVIQKLESLCIDSALPSLPKFVVVGDQSAGKSSIVEAICDIKLPRGSGTCTRCPFQITTTAAKSHDTSWVCKIILQRKSALHRGRDGIERWLDQDSLNSFHFATITNKALLGDVLRRAQLAILNPQKDPFMFSNMAIMPDRDTKVEFSPNVVSLEIEAPGLPDLSFYDLPGAINVHELGHKHLVKLVENLVKDFVSDEKALIMLACSADQDVETSTAFKYVADCEAISRTIGVLTKPDLVGAHRLPSLRRILNGEIFKLGAWFVTKQLSQEEIDHGGIISHATARERECQFFANDPWCTKLGTFRHRFGIQNLQDFISHKLSAHILSELPEIVSRVQDRLSEVDQALDLFPRAPDSPTHTVISVVQNLTDSVTQNVMGQNLQHQFLDSWRILFKSLRTQLKLARLQIDLTSPDYMPSTIEIDDDEPNDTVESPTPKIRKGNHGHPLPSTPQRQMPRSTPRSARVKAEDITDDLKAPRLTLSEIRQSLNAGSNSGLPDVMDPKVLEHFIRESNVRWPSLVEDLLDKIRMNVQRMLGESIDRHLSNRTKTQLHAQTCQIVQAFGVELFETQTKSVRHILSCHFHKPITYNDALMSELRTITSKKLQDAREAQRLHEYFEGQKAKSMKTPPVSEYHKHADKLAADGFGRELEAMAFTLSFYDVSSASLVDFIARQLQFGLLHPLESKLAERLMVGLRVSDNTYCTQLLAEDPAAEAERSRLLDEHHKLTTALNELNALPQQAFN
nr:interferon-induced gtp-binding protein mx3 [Quercus suber]